MAKCASSLARWFEEKGIRNKDIADKLGLSPSSVSNMLSGKDSLGYKRCHEIEKHYGLSAQHLLRGEIVEVARPETSEAINNSAVIHGDNTNSPINIVADNAALIAENQRLREEVAWLRQMLENASRMQ